LHGSTADKGNGITAIPELLDALWHKGTSVTIDAMGCLRPIAGRIVQAQDELWRDLHPQECADAGRTRKKDAS